MYIAAEMNAVPVWLAYRMEQNKNASESSSARSFTYAALASIKAYKIGTFLPNSPVNYVHFLAFDSQNAHVL